VRGGRFERRTFLYAFRLTWSARCTCCRVRTWSVEQWVKGLGWIALGAPGRRPRPAHFAAFGPALAFLKSRSPATARAVAAAVRP